MNLIYRTAMEYLQLGFPVFPIATSWDEKAKKVLKKPLVSWKKYQDVLPSTDDVRRWFTKDFPNAQLCISTGKLSDTFVIDADSQEMIKTIESMLPDVPIPTQLTPGHNGKHYFFKHSEGFVNRAEYEKGLDVRTEGGLIMMSPSDDSRGNKWKWEKDKSIQTVKRIELPENIKHYLRTRLKNTSYNFIDEDDESDEPTVWFANGRRDSDLFHIAYSLIKGKKTNASITTDVLIRLVNSWGEHDPAWVDAKVKSAIQRAATTEESNLEEIEKYIMAMNGNFAINGIINWFGIKDTIAKNQVLFLMQQLEKNNIIIPVGNKNGLYRLVDNDPQIMDLDQPMPKKSAIKLPFLLHDIVDIYPKNVILVAGEKDSGKTCFAMNTAYMNRNIFKVRYLNSEMGIAELRHRLSKFPKDNFEFSEWKKIEWIEKSSKFEDMIDPDGLNIIDYLEIGAEAFAVTEDIKKVFDKLKNGILLIVMQKRTYKEYAVGGEGTLEKARLSVNLERIGGENIGRITVAKNWSGVLENPKGKICKYKIWNGGKMKMTEYWHEEEVKKPQKRGFVPKNTMEGVSSMVEDEGGYAWMEK